MNIFFYSPRDADCSNGCLYSACPERCLSRLRSIDTLKEIAVLHGNLHSVFALNMWLRSGDLILLFAATWYELEQLIGMQDAFESFRIVLIFGSDEYLNDQRYHQLKPRYIFSLDKSLFELESVVNKMMLVSSSDNT